MKRICSLLLLPCLLAACTHRVGTLAVAFTSPLETLQPAGYDAASPRILHGEDCKPIILGTPSGIPTVTAALKDAVKKAGPGCVGLREVSVRMGYYDWWFFGKAWFEVSGKPVFQK